MKNSTTVSFFIGGIIFAIGVLEALLVIGLSTSFPDQKTPLKEWVLIFSYVSMLIIAGSVLMRSSARKAYIISSLLVMAHFGMLYISQIS